MAEAGGTVDAGLFDTGLSDAGLFDTGLSDAGLFDTGLFDAGLLDPLAQGTDALALTGDAAFLGAMRDVEVALARAVCEAGLSPEWMAGVCEVVASGALDLGRIAAGARSGGNPTIPLVKQLGEIAEGVHAGASDHLHLGATSQDIVDSAAMVVGARVLESVDASLVKAGTAFAALAVAHRSTPMVGRTLGQHATPTTFGFVAAGWLDGVTQALVRVRQVRSSLPVQLGGAVGTLEVLGHVAGATGTHASAIAASETPVEQPRGGVPKPTPVDPVGTVDRVVAGTASRLGLRAPVISWHTNRLPITDLASALAGAVGALGAFAVDVSALSRTEVGELSERLGAGEGGSSAMPHKRNPITAVLLVSAAKQTPGLLSTLYAAVAAEDQRPIGAWHSEWLALRGVERVAVSAAAGAAGLAARLDVHEGRMLGNLGTTNGAVFSERLSGILSHTLGKSAGFALAGRASAVSAETGRSLADVVDELLAAGGADGSGESGEAGVAGDTGVAGGAHGNTAIREAVAGAFDLGAPTPTIDAAIDRVVAAFTAVADGQ